MKMVKRMLLAAVAALFTGVAMQAADFSTCFSGDALTLNDMKSGQIFVNTVKGVFAGVKGAAENAVGPINKEAVITAAFTSFENVVLAALENSPAVVQHGNVSDVDRKVMFDGLVKVLTENEAVLNKWLSTQSGTALAPNKVSDLTKLVTEKTKQFIARLAIVFAPAPKATSMLAGLWKRAPEKTSVQMSAVTNQVENTRMQRAKRVGICVLNAVVYTAAVAAMAVTTSYAGDMLGFGPQ